MNSTNFNAQIRRCEEFIASKSFKKADDAVTNAIQINGDSPYAWYLKAKVSIGLLEYEKALKASEKAIELNPKGEYVELKANVENFLNLDADDLASEYPNKMDNMVALTSAVNIRLLNKRKLNPIVYDGILDDIKADADKSALGDGEIYHKLRKLAESFIDLEFITNSDNESSRKMAGAYGFKRAVIDSNLSKTLQIGAMIHELAHHLAFEIFKNAIMYLYRSQNTDAIEAFGWYGLTRNVYGLLMNEYCAHTVECHYMQLKNYESFNNILRIYDNLEEEKVKKAVELGNSLAGDIIYMLDEFFTKEVIEEIRMQFLSDRVILLRKGCEFKSEAKLSDDEKFSMINSLLRETIIHIKINFSYGELNQFKKIFANTRG